MKTIYRGVKGWFNIFALAVIVFGGQGAIIGYWNSLWSFCYLLGWFFVVGTGIEYVSRKQKTKFIKDVMGADFENKEVRKSVEDLIKEKLKNAK